VPFGNDGDFSKSSMISRMNNELANDYGNLAQRVLSMITKNLDGQIPAQGDFTDEDKRLLEAARSLPEIVRPLIDAQTFHEALERIWIVIRASNAYVDHQAPWVLRKSDPPRMGTVLYVLAETIRCLAIMTQPFMPESSGRMLDQLAVPPDGRSFSSIAMNKLVPGTVLPRPQGIFPRFLDEEASA
jgi:methionyl-tRNA synthetase